MGGASYTPSARRSSTGYSSARSIKEDHLPEAQVSNLRKKGEPENRPINRGIISTDSKNPVIVAFDDTGSMGQWVDEFYRRAPMFYGQIKLHHYLEDPAMSFAVVGDYNGDDEPLQVTDFCRGDALDQALESIFIERGGGGGHKESYQLAPYYYLRHCQLSEERDAKPFFFFFGDEGFYERISEKELKDVFGGDDHQAVSSSDLFSEMKEKFDCFILRKPYSMPSAEEIINADWQSALTKERVVMLETGSQVVDTMLGIIAMRAGVSLKDYLVSLKKRKQTDQRISDVKNSLAGLAETMFKQTNPEGSAIQLPIRDGNGLEPAGPDQQQAPQGEKHADSKNTTIINVSGDIITGGKLVKGSEITDSVINRSEINGPDPAKKKKKDDDGSSDE